MTDIDESPKKKSFNWRLWLGLLLGLVLGFAVIVVVRAVAAKSDAVHYHADFALYVNGQPEKFQGPGFYEEVETCSVSNIDNPKAGVHMHDQNNHVVHVEAHAVTWGQFFANLGYTLGDNVMGTENGVFVDGQNGNKLSFILNGQPITNVADRVIKDQDVLLINYGQDDKQTLVSRYNAIPRDAAKEDQEKDPASCSGSGHALTTSERFKQAVEFWQ